MGFLSDKPYTAVSSTIERLTDETHDDDDFSEIVELVDIIRIRTTGYGCHLIAFIANIATDQLKPPEPFARNLNTAHLESNFVLSRWVLPALSTQQRANNNKDS